MAGWSWILALGGFGQLQGHCQGMDPTLCQHVFAGMDDLPVADRQPKRDTEYSVANTLKIFK